MAKSLTLSVCCYVAGRLAFSRANPLKIVTRAALVAAASGLHMARKNRAPKTFLSSNVMMPALCQSFPARGSRPHATSCYMIQKPTGSLMNKLLWIPNDACKHRIHYDTFTCCRGASVESHSRSCSSTTRILRSRFESQTLSMNGIGPLTQPTPILK